MADRKMTAGAAGRRASLVEEAREKGRQARLADKPRDCPIAQDDYPTRGLRAAWLEGWDAAAASQLAIKTQELEVKTQGVEMKTRAGGAPATFLPEGEPMPGTYSPQGPVPCERCRALLLPSKARAVVLRGTDGGLAYFWCRACGERFKRPLA